MNDIEFQEALDDKLTELRNELKRLSKKGYICPTSLTNALLVLSGAPEDSGVFVPLRDGAGRPISLEKLNIQTLGLFEKCLLPVKGRAIPQLKASYRYFAKSAGFEITITKVVEHGEDKLLVLRKT